MGTACRHKSKKRSNALLSLSLFGGMICIHKKTGSNSTA
jgi:hypothetical protein